MTAIQQGTRVKIPAGTFVRSASRANPGPSKRTQIVTVDHTFPPRRIEVGYYVKNENYVDIRTRARGTADRHVRADLEERFGTSDLETLIERGIVEAVNDGSNVVRLVAKLHEGEVVWAGSGGYWRWVDMAAVTVVDD